MKIISIEKKNPVAARVVLLLIISDQQTIADISLHSKMVEPPQQNETDDDIKDVIGFRKNMISSWIRHHYTIPTVAYIVSLRKIINPIRAKFFRRNKNIYLHFVSFLHIDTTQVVEIHPQIRQEPTYST